MSRDRSRRVLLAAILALSCLSGACMFGAPPLFDAWFSWGLPEPMIPAYPTAQQLQINREYRDGTRYKRENFVTADSPAEVKAYYARTLGPPGALWLSATGLGYYQYTPDGPQTWMYDSDYCPITSVQVTFPPVEPGMTAVELTTTSSSCLDRLPFRLMPRRP